MPFAVCYRYHNFHDFFPQGPFKIMSFKPAWLKRDAAMLCRCCVAVYSLVPDVDVILASTEDADRPGRPDCSADGPGGGWGPEPGLLEGSKAEALSQAEEVKRMEGLQWWNPEEVKRWKRILRDLKWLLYFSLQRTDLKSRWRDKISWWVRRGAARWHISTVLELPLKLERNCCTVKFDLHPLPSCFSSILSCPSHKAILKMDRCYQ